MGKCSWRRVRWKKNVITGMIWSNVIYLCVKEKSAKKKNKMLILAKNTFIPMAFMAPVFLCLLKLCTPFISSLKTDISTYSLLKLLELIFYADELLWTPRDELLMISTAFSVQLSPKSMSLALNSEFHSNFSLSSGIDGTQCCADSSLQLYYPSCKFHLTLYHETVCLSQLAFIWVSWDTYFSGALKKNCIWSFPLWHLK